MMYIIISLVMIVIGLFGVIKSKFPKYEVSAKYIAIFKLYLVYILFLILGVVFFIINISQLF